MRTTTFARWRMRSTHLADCQVVLNLGDLVFEYRVETEIVEIARRAGLIGIAGNHEKAILQHPGSSVRDRVPADILDYLKALPASRTMAVDGFDLLIAHGAPWDDPDDFRCDYVHERNNAAMERMRSVAGRHHPVGAYARADAGRRRRQARDQPRLMRRCARSQ